MGLTGTPPPDPLRDAFVALGDALMPLGIQLHPAVLRLWRQIQRIGALPFGPDGEFRDEVVAGLLGAVQALRDDPANPGEPAQTGSSHATVDTAPATRESAPRAN